MSSKITLTNLCLSIILVFCLSAFLSICPSVVGLSVLVCHMQFTFNSSLFILLRWKSSWCQLRPVQFIRRFWRMDWSGWDGMGQSSQVSGLLRAPSVLIMRISADMENINQVQPHHCSRQRCCSESAGIVAEEKNGLLGQLKKNNAVHGDTRQRRIEN